MRAFLLQALALADVLYHRDGEVRHTLRGPHQRDGHMRPDEHAILADVALVHRGLIYLASEQGLEGFATRGEAVEVGDVLDSKRRERVAVGSEEAAQALGASQRAPARAHVCDAGRR